MKPDRRVTIGLCAAALWMGGLPLWRASAVDEPEIRSLMYSKRTPGLWSGHAFGLFYVDADGMDWRLSSVFGERTIPRRSPDGSRAMFTSSFGGRSGIWIVHLDEDRTERLCDGADGAWSPDSARIAFHRNDILLERDLDSGTERSLISGVPGIRWPEYAPDGARLLYTAGTDLAREIRILSVNGKESRTVAAGEILSPPRWSPDGQTIVFQDGASLVLLHPQGRRLVPTPGGIPSFPAWSRNGNGLAYALAPKSGGPWRLVATDLQGSREPFEIMADAYASFDIEWDCPQPVAAPERGLRFAASDGQLAVSRDGARAVLEAVPPAAADRFERGTWHVRAPANEGHVILRCAAEAVVVPDRLGDDLTFDAETDGESFDVSHAPMVLLLLQDGAGMVIAAMPEPGRNLRLVREGGGGFRLEAAGGILHVGLLRGNNLWKKNPAQDWTPPFPATWRAVSRTADGLRRAGMLSGPVDPEEKNVKERRMLAWSGTRVTYKDLGAFGDALTESQDGIGEAKSVYIYPFERIPGTPGAPAVVSDVLWDLFGLEQGDAVAGRTAAIRYRGADTWTLFSSVETTLDGIDNALRRQGWDAYIAEEVNAWCDDVVALLEAMEKRIGQYEGLARDLDALLTARPTPGLEAIREGFAARLKERAEIPGLDPVRAAIVSVKRRVLRPYRIPKMVVEPGV